MFLRIVTPAYFQRLTDYEGTISGNVIWRRNGRSRVWKMKGLNTSLDIQVVRFLHIYDALFHKHGKIPHILVRHEQAATHAADGYARATGKPGV